MNDKKWSIEWYSLGKNNKKTQATIGEGLNEYCDGLERIIGTFERYEDAELICNLHNDQIKAEEESYIKSIGGQKMITRTILSGISLVISSDGEKFTATISRDNGHEIDVLAEVADKSQGGAIYEAMNKLREIAFQEARA